MRNPGPDVLSLTEKVNILLAISHKGSAAKQRHKEPTPRAASWTFSSGEDGCVWFNFVGFPGKILPYCHMLLHAFSLTLLSYQYFLQSCVSQCFHHPQRDLLEYLVVFHVSDCHLHMWILRAKLSAGWELTKFHWLQQRCSNLKAAEGLQMGKNRHSASKHTRISALQPVSSHRPYFMVCFGYKISQFSRGSISIVTPSILWQLQLCLSLSKSQML